MGAADSPVKKQILVAVGQRFYTILPDKDVDLGVIDHDEIVLTR